MVMESIKYVIGMETKEEDLAVIAAHAVTEASVHAVILQDLHADSAKMVFRGFLACLAFPDCLGEMGYPVHVVARARWVLQAQWAQ